MNTHLWLIDLRKTARKNQKFAASQRSYGANKDDDLILERRVVLATEHTFSTSSAKALSPFPIEMFVQNVRKIVPAICSSKNERRYFLANGGSIAWDFHGELGKGVTVLETVTPDCRSPLDLIESHHAIREVVATACKELKQDGSLRIFQGNQDGHGHRYGQLESYEVNVAQGIHLHAWRIGLLLLLPCLLLYRFAAAVWLLAIVFISRTESIARKILRRPFLKESSSLEEADSANDMALELIATKWVYLCARGLRALHAPLVFLFWCNIQCFALRRYRKQLVPFFASRCILDGSGFLDDAGRFGVSLCGSRINSVIGFGGYGSSQPIFRCDAWLRDLCVGGPLSLNRFWKLFRRRQRVEIAIGDSGLCHHSQYVRIGATSLMFDLAEHVPMPDVPKLRLPLVATRRFAMDWMLLAKEPDRSGQNWSACQIQRAYATAAKQMLENTRDIPKEATTILATWSMILNQLDLADETSEPSKDLVGRVDWVTKLWLLDQFDSDVSKATRSKLDLRYHELSDEGYALRVLDVLSVPPIATYHGVERAKKNPPKASSSLARAYLIREFGDPSSQLELDWDQANWVLDGEKQSARFN